MPFTVSTREYEFSHSHKPRGYGNWAFTYNDRTGDKFPLLAWRCGSYGEARRDAVREAKRVGFDSMEVGS